MLLSFKKYSEWKKMLNYLGFYFKRYVLLLADVSQTFRKESTNSFLLDPLRYISNPGYSWDAIDISDIEKQQFIENTIRGSNSVISKGYPGANNKFLKSCNPNKPT